VRSDDVRGDGALAGRELASLLYQRVVLPALACLGVPSVVCVGGAAGHYPLGWPAAAALLAGGLVAAGVVARSGARRLGEAAADRHDRQVQKFQDQLHTCEQQFSEKLAGQAHHDSEVIKDLSKGFALALSDLRLQMRPAQAAAERERDHFEQHNALTAGWLEFYLRTCEAASDQLKTSLDQIRQGRVPVRPAVPEMPARKGMFADVEMSLNLLGHQALDAVVQAASSANTGDPAAELKPFAKIAQRLIGRATRVLVELDKLESGTEDPAALARMFQVDLHVTLIRRDMASVLVLLGHQLQSGGGPADLNGVLRQAMAATDDFARERVIGSTPAVQIVGYAAPGLIHILAMLIENAARFSRDQVHVTSALAGSDLRVTVEDQGLHMTPEDLRWANAVLGGKTTADVRARLAEGQIGLLVTAGLAAQYGITVELLPNDSRGTRAVVVVPSRLLMAPEPPTAPPPRPISRQRPGTARASDEAPRSPAMAVMTTLPPQGWLAAPPRAVTAAGEQPVGGRPALPQRARIPQAHSATDAPDSPPAVGEATPGLAAAYVEGSRRAERHRPDDTPDR
jgi:hypothetical protein